MADNKWTKPKNPPPPLFLGEKERNLVKQVNDELIERVVGQGITYLPLSVEYTNFHPLYGEAIEKSFLPPVKVNALVTFDGKRTITENYGLDKEYSITVKFHERRLYEDQNLYIREGDYVQYGGTFFEIVALEEDRELFGQVDHRFQIIAKCIKTRKGLVNLKAKPLTIQEGALANSAMLGASSSDSSSDSSPEASSASSGGSGGSSGSGASSPSVPGVYVGAQVVHRAVDSFSLVPGTIGRTITAGENINDFFEIPVGTTLHRTTIMIFQNGILQALSDSASDGEFHVNSDNKIITNYEISPGTSLTAVFLTALGPYV